MIPRGEVGLIFAGIGKRLKVIDECNAERQNLTLVHRYSHAARQGFATRGVELDRLDAIGYSEERPFDQSLRGSMGQKLAAPSHLAWD